MEDNHIKHRAISMTKVLSINKTLAVICDCWCDAESELQNQIRDFYPGKGEVFITESFHGLLAKSLNSASTKKTIEKAFIRDLKAVSPSYRWDIISRKIANGLIAEVRLHSSTTEAKTGGDLGFVISRPKLSLEWEYSQEKELFITKDNRRGLLTQAKLKNDEGKWGHFTKSQKEKLPQHLDYLALLLYEYNDPRSRRNFQKFKWQLCAGSSFPLIEKWMKTDEFPATMNSTKIIKELGTSIIGTDNPNIIDTVICPPENQTLTIDIHWPGGDPPLSRVRVDSKQETTQKAKEVSW